MAKINALALLITNHRSLITFSAVTFAPEAFNSQGNYKNSSDTLFRLLGASLACKRQSGSDRLQSPSFIFKRDQSRTPGDDNRAQSPRSKSCLPE
jgi:hypothetical protein